MTPGYPLLGIGERGGLVLEVKLAPAGAPAVTILEHEDPRPVVLLAVASHRAPFMAGNGHLRRQPALD
jgi:hypothetical protein